MCKRLGLFALATVLVGIVPQFAVAQAVYEFDGTPDDPNYANDPNNQPYDPTDWETSVNWNEAGFDPTIEPVPELTIRVEIDEFQYGVNAPVIGPGDTAEAFGVRIGRSAGAGLLTMTGGTLDIAEKANCVVAGDCRRLRVGNDDSTTLNQGTFNLSDGTVTTDSLWIGSGSFGEMNMSGGIVNTRADLSFDWTFDQSSVLNLTAGTINVDDQVRMYRTSVINLDGGEILIDGAARLGTNHDGDSNPLGTPQTPAVSVSITDGLLEAVGFLEVGGMVTIDGGILRARRYEDHSDPNATSVIEVNGSGLLQFNNSVESVLDVEALITAGIITTSEASPLTVSVVDVDGTDFTQVSFGAACGTGDFDCNGIVDGKDFLLWQTNPSVGSLSDWENNYPAPLVAAVASVPEPSSIVLTLLLSVWAVAGHRRSHAGKK